MSWSRADIQSAHERAGRRWKHGVYQHVPWWRIKMVYFIKKYPADHNGESPSKAAIARHFNRPHHWAMKRINELIQVGVLRQTGRTLLLVDESQEDAA